MMDKPWFIYIFVCSYAFIAFLYHRRIEIARKLMPGLNMVLCIRNQDKCEINPKHNLEKMDNESLISNEIFWSELAESYVPKGLSFEESTSLMSYLRDQNVLSISEGNALVCGRRGNAVAYLHDGTIMCVRHRSSIYIQAEVLTFYLSRMLKMDNVPSVILVRLNDSTFSRPRRLNYTTLPWRADESVAMVKWLPEFSSNVHLPRILRKACIKGEPITSDVIHSLEHGFARNRTSISELIQLGTLLLFDFLNCNSDRFKFWRFCIKGDAIYKIHNTIQSSTGKILLIDNECTFRCPITKWGKKVGFRERLLIQTMCIFQASLVRELQVLSNQTFAFKRVLKYAQSFEPLLQISDYFESVAFLTDFDRRITYIIEWIQHCQGKSDQTADR